MADSRRGKGKKKDEAPESRIAYHLNQIDTERKKWDYYNIHGTTDLIWPDGVGLNLTRNHIIYHLFEIAAIRNEMTGVQLSTFDSPTDQNWGHIDRAAVMQDKRIPPEVPDYLMVVDRPLNIAECDRSRLIYRTKGA